MSDDNVLNFPRSVSNEVVNYTPEHEVNPNVVDTPPTTEEEFFRNICHFAQIGMQIARQKNHDYAGNGDPFANFSNSQAVGVSTPRGILVRMMDKIARISNLIQRPPAVVNESLIDTCVDLSNYALILAAYIKMHPNEDV